jgi:outer membrane protein W
MTTRQIALTLAAATAALVLAPAAAGAQEPAEPWWKRRFYVRGLGVAHVATLEQSREMELADIDGPASLAVSEGPIPGSGAKINSATIFAASLGFRLPVLQDRLSLEVIVGNLFTVEFTATGTLANESIAPTALGIPTGVPALGEQLGRAQAVPLVNTAVYRILDRGVLQPYAGAGLAVLFARKAEITNPVLTEVGQPDFSIDPAPGLVLQAGLDAKVWKNIYARVDVKFIAGMLARANVEHVQVRTPALPLFESAEVGTAKMSVWVNPLIVQAGLGFDFTIF